MKPITLVVALYCCIVSLPSFSQAVVATEVIDNPAPTVIVNANCLKHFAKSFTNTATPRWTETENGFTAHFSQNETLYDVRYNHKGRWVCTIKYLPIEQLNKNVARTVYNQYRDYHIFFAQQVSVSSGSAYFIKIEKENQWKYLRVVSGAIEVLGEYVKR
jgi:hypothetical protein